MGWDIPQGTRFLVQVGVRLKSALRSVVTVARLGGDEFVALCENLAVEDAEEQLETIVKRNRGMFDGSFMTSLGPATLGASIGWALVRPEADVDLTMVGTADQAMLDDKCVVMSTTIPRCGCWPRASSAPAVTSYVSSRKRPTGKRQ